MKLSINIPIPRIRRRKAPAPAVGSPPGTLAVRADLPAPKIQRTVYDGASLDVGDVDPNELGSAFEPVPGKTVWVDVQGLGDEATLRRVGAALGIHPLTIEDIAHVQQRPKLEEFEEYLLISVRSVRLLEGGQVEDEQISLIVEDGLIVSFQERPGDSFEPIRRRLRQEKRPIRSAGADYLAYALVDATIDAYYPVVDAYSDTMDQLDDAVREQPTPGVSQAIHRVRRELRQLRRAVWPLRDVTSALSRQPIPLISDGVRPGFRECYDNTVQLADFVDGGRERASDLGDLFLVMVSERTNQIMKTLTIIATMFIPLTFLCGLYGMNFDPDASPYNMPELRWRYGYVTFWGVMIAMVLGMLYFFRRKGWIGGGGQPKDPG